MGAVSHTVRAYESGPKAGRIENEPPIADNRLEARFGPADPAA